MNLEQARQIAPEFGIDPDGFTSPESFVRTVENAHDRKLKDIITKKNCESRQKYKWYKEHTHGHDFSDYDFLCIHCGKDIREYIRETNVYFPLSILCPRAVISD